MFWNFQKPAFGIDISDHSIEIVSLKGQVLNPRLLAMGRKILNPGIVVSGSIMDKEQLKKDLKDLIGSLQFGRLDSKRAVLAIPDSKSYIRIFELPSDLDKKEIPQYVESKTKENIPHSLEEIYFDFFIQGKRVCLAATPKKVADDYLEVFKECGLEIICLENESFSLGRALIGGEENILVADIGARTTNFSLFSKGFLTSSFSLNLAGNNFTQALSEKLNISFDSAENLKKEVGLNPRFQEGKVFLILQKEIQEIVEEAKKIINYFKDKTGQSPEKIILAGGSSSLKGIAQYLAENLGLAVEIGDPWVKINIDILKKKEYLKEALQVNPVLYSTVIGCALRGLKKDPEKSGINFLKGRLKN